MFLRLKSLNSETTAGWEIQVFDGSQLVRTHFHRFYSCAWNDVLLLQKKYKIDIEKVAESFNAKFDNIENELVCYENDTLISLGDDNYNSMLQGDIIYDYNEGMAVSDIAAAYNITVDKVYKLLKRVKKDTENKEPPPSLFDDN